MPSPRRSSLTAVGALLAIGALLTGCVPEPTPTSSTTTSTAPGVASPSPTESETPPSEADFTFPASCDSLHSPDMTALLQAEIPPLNDPGTTMLSTENTVAIGILEGAEQTLRCTWGPPSERGIATTVAVITPDERDALFTAFEEAGFSSEDYRSGTLHSIQQEMMTLDDTLVTLGETHYLAGEAWIATRWIQYLPEGYTQDIVDTIWE